MKPEQGGRAELLALVGAHSRPSAKLTAEQVGPAKLLAPCALEDA